MAARDASAVAGGSFAPGATFVLFSSTIRARTQAIELSVSTSTNGEFGGADDAVEAKEGLGREDGESSCSFILSAGVAAEVDDDDAAAAAADDDDEGDDFGSCCCCTVVLCRIGGPGATPLSNPAYTGRSSIVFAGVCA